MNRKIKPNAVNSNIENGWRLYSVIIELTTRLVDVPMRVKVPPKIAA